MEQNIAMNPSESIGDTQQREVMVDVNQIQKQSAKRVNII